LNYLKQDYQKAQAFYLQANRMQPAALNPLLGLLNVAQATSDATGAQRIIESILRIDPLNYRAQMAEASQDLKDHNYQRALTVYRKVLQNYPDDVDARSGEAWALYSFGYKDEAKASFQIILSVNPSYPLAQQGLSLCQNAVASKM
jgi:tetratricopeptide (TPR) repeat protein